MSDQKTVLILRSAIGVFGAERVILELAAGLKDSQYAPVIGVIENRHKSHAELISAARAARLPAVLFRCRKPFDLKTALEIRSYIKQNHIAIIHPHGYKANFYTLMSSAFIKIPRIATCHPWTETDYNIRARVYTFLDKTWLKKMDGVVAVSQEVRRELHKRLPEAKCEVIANGIDLQRFCLEKNGNSLRKSFEITGSDFLIGTIGRLVPEKGYQYLITAAKAICRKYPRVKFIVVGNGPLQSELEKLVADNDLGDKIQFSGIRGDIPELLSIMNLFVLPSVSEGVPMVLLEAMAAGKPVISTEVGDIPQIIRHGYSGWLIPPKNTEALAAAMEELIQDSNKAERLALAAREEVKNRFSAKNMASQYIHQYNLAMLHF
jgi:glycosyltransferase involved in cell wall biosynthesis